MSQYRVNTVSYKFTFSGIVAMENVFISWIPSTSKSWSNVCHGESWNTSSEDWDANITVSSCRLQ